MIKCKKDLKFYLAADMFALGKQGKPTLWGDEILGDEIWKFQIALRKCEYYRNKKGIFKCQYTIWKIKKRQLGLQLGFEIPEGVFGAGLRINHFGNIIINGSCSIGRWCDIHQGVNIGASNPEKRICTHNYTPQIGDNVWIGPGAKLFGDITIGSQVQIGANAVVCKSFGDNVTIAGVPAKIIKETGTSAVDVAANPVRKNEFFKRYPEFKEYYK